MIIKGQEFHINRLTYTIRSAAETDAEQLSEIRVQIDRETENMDREAGEGFINKIGFQNIIKQIVKRVRTCFSCRSAQSNRWIFKMRRGKFEETIS